jgi:predicted nucleotidyltransferase
MQNKLTELVAKLTAAAGANLKCVVLYGSAVTGEFHPKHSDLNVLCIVQKLGAYELGQLNAAARWWTSQGHPAPLAFTLEELQHAVDVFAIELLDIKSSHRVLLGEDVLTNLEVPMKLHHLQVERELRTNVVRLRQSYLAAPRDGKTTLRLMMDSVSSFVVLFRHALIALGQPQPEPVPAAPPEPKPAGTAPEEPKSRTPERGRDVVDRLAKLLGFNPIGFHIVLDVRQGRKQERHVDVPSTFNTYLEAVSRVAEEVDRRLDAVNR